MRKAWDQVRWKMCAIVAFTAMSTLLMGCLAVAVINVVIRRESANVVRKQIEMLVDEAGSGLVVDRGQLQIQRGPSHVALGPELAERLSKISGLKVMPVSPRPFRVHPANQHLLGTIEGNFVPGFTPTTAVVLTVQNLETGTREDWIAYTVRASYANTFHDLAQLGTQRANWVWLLVALASGVFLLDAAGAWMCFRLGSDIASAIDELSYAARQIASGNFGWRTPQHRGQLGELVQTFNHTPRKPVSDLHRWPHRCPERRGRGVWRGSPNRTLPQRARCERSHPGRRGMVCPDGAIRRYDRHCGGYRALIDLK